MAGCKSAQAQIVDKGNMESKGLINRYRFISYIYPSRIIIILRKGNYYVYNDSELILKYIKYKGNTLKLKDKHINYIVVENLDIVEIENYKDNKYEEYLLKSKLANIVNNIKYYVTIRSMESLDANIKKGQVKLIMSPNSGNSNNAF